MDSLRIGLSVARNNMRKYLFSWRSLMIALVALMLIYARSSEVRQLCDIYGALASPLPLFVSFTNSLYPGTVLLVCWVLLVCDAPFIDESQPMLLLRAGRARWSLGQVAFLWGYALVYWLYVMLLCVLVLLPHVEWSMGWSDVYRSLEITGESGNLKFYGSVMSEYSALSACLFSLALNYTLSVAFAQLIYAINFATGKNYGAVLPVLFIMLEYFFQNWFVDNRFLFISPVSLARLHRLLLVNGPSLRYAMGTLWVLALATAGVAVAIVRHRSIDVSKPV